MRLKLADTEKYRLDASVVRELLVYEPLTGIFTWRDSPLRPRNWRAVHAGKQAGNLCRGCHRIQIFFSGKKRVYKAAILAWLYMTSEWPPDEVDHMDCDPSNDKWENLRAATCSQNKCNQRLLKRNTSGAKGVHWDTGRQAWRARIQIGKRRQHLGEFSTVEAASAAYAKAAAVLHGEFARIK